MTNLQAQELSNNPEKLTENNVLPLKLFQIWLFVYVTLKYQFLVCVTN